MSDRRSSDSADGFTLIELLVYMMLIGLVLAIVGAMMTNTMRTSNTVTSVTEASNAGQFAAHSIEKGIRNSSDFNLTSPAGNDQLLIARTALSGATLTWKCAAWYYSSAGDGSIRYMISDGAIPLAPTSAQLATWTLLAEGIEPVTGTTIFSTPVSSKQLSIAFHGLAGDHPPVAISSSAHSRAGAVGSPACY
jgi:prepilin-type N-terminal cleavage/methylation domain-containing protein